MARDVTFWRNAAVIGAAHVAVIAGIARWNTDAKKARRSGIVWMAAPPAAQTAASPQSAAATTAPALPEAEPPADVHEQPLADAKPIAPARNEIPLPRPSPSVTPKAKPTPAPSTTPKPSPKPKSTPKPPVLAKASPKRSATPVEAEEKPAKQSSTVKVTAAPSGSASGASTTAAAAAASQSHWYGNMLHDRFFGAWEQPTSATATGSRMSTLVQLRIEADGRVSNFAIVRSSGNVVVDESVAAVGKRVTKVDPPPAGLSATGHYDVKINFELNVE